METHFLSGKMGAPTLRWAGMSAFLVCETELVLSGHLERMIIQPLVHLQFYRWFLAFLFFAGVIRILGEGRESKFPDYPLSRLFLLVHLGYVAGLNWSLTPMATLIGHDPLRTWLWLPVKAVYVLSWLAILVPPSRWLSTVRGEWSWLAPAVVGSGLTAWIGTASRLLWMPLASATLWCSSVVLDFFMSDLVVAPDDLIIGTTHFQIHIAGACSGIEGIGLMVGYLSCYLVYRRKQLTLPEALWLFPLGISIIWLMNVGRIAALVIIGAWVSPEIAVSGFHSQAGWLSFSVVSLGLTMAVEKSGWFWAESSRSEDGGHPSAPYVVPLAALLFSWMVSQAFSAGFDDFYPVRILVVSAVLLAFRKSYSPLLQEISLRSAWIGVLVYGAWVGLVGPGAEKAVSPWEHFSPLLATGWVIFRILGAVVVIPLVEELAFRGFLIRRLQKREFETLPAGQVSLRALLLSSLAFGLLHQHVGAGILAGLAFGHALKKNGRLADAVVAHATANLCLAFHVLLAGEWALWN